MTDHLRKCFDGDGGTTTTCPVCEEVFDAEVEEAARLEHVDRCVRMPGKLEGKALSKLLILYKQLPSTQISLSIDYVCDVPPGAEVSHNFWHLLSS